MKKKRKRIERENEVFLMVSKRLIKREIFKKKDHNQRVKEEDSELREKKKEKKMKCSMSMEII
jgi:hypothetical protein